MRLPGRGILWRKAREWLKKRTSVKEVTVETKPELREVEVSDSQLQKMNKQQMADVLKKQTATIDDLKQSLSNLQSEVQQRRAMETEEMGEERKKEYIRQLLDQKEEEQKEKKESIKQLRINDQRLGVEKLPVWFLFNDNTLPTYRYFYGWREEEKEGKRVKIPLVVDDPHGKNEPRPVRNIEVENEEEIFESKAGIIGQYNSGAIHTLIDLKEEDGIPILIRPLEEIVETQGNNPGEGNNEENVKEEEVNKISTKEREVLTTVNSMKERINELQEELEQTQNREQLLNQQLHAYEVQLDSTDQQRKYWSDTATQVFQNQVGTTEELSQIMGNFQDQTLNRLISQQQAHITSEGLRQMREDLQKILPQRTEDVLRKKIMDEMKEFTGGGGGDGIDTNKLSEAISSAVREGFEKSMAEIMRAGQEGGAG